MEIKKNLRVHYATCYVYIGSLVCALSNMYALVSSGMEKIEVRPVDDMHWGQ